MKNLDLFVIANLLLSVGVAGLLWPEKLLPVFDVLMFPWSASHRMIRIHSVAAIILWLLLAGRLIMS